MRAPATLLAVRECVAAALRDLEAALEHTRR
jgi:hypothetical protein